MLFDYSVSNTIEDLMVPLDKPLIIVMDFGGNFRIRYGLLQFV